MDTEKKVQFVALTKEEIDAMIQQAALAGAQVASDAMMVGQRKSEKEKIDRRLHNTDLLLRNYRTLKASYENAVYKSKEGEVTEVLEDIMTMKDDILAYIHYYDVKLPPIYDWEKGYLCGTHPWPARQYMETEQQGWKEVYDIDKTIVENAAQHFDGARDFLKAIK